VAIVIDAAAPIVVWRVVLVEHPGRRVVHDPGAGSDGAVGELDLVEAPARQLLLPPSREEGRADPHGKR
jgi:hypothetical protein